MTARKLYPASNPGDDRLFDQLFFHQEVLDHANPVVSVVTPATAHTEFSVLHDLGRVARGYLLIASDAPVTLYKGDGEWTRTEITLKATEADVHCEIVIL